METTQVLGVDRSSPFSEDELDTLKATDKVEVIGVYLGGPYFAGTPANAAYIESIFSRDMGIVPIYVGQNKVSKGPDPVLTVAQGDADANHAIELFRALGIGVETGDCIFLDVESSTFAYNAAECGMYVAQWLKIIKENDHTDGMYGSLATVDYLIRLEEPPTNFWLASWVSKSVDASLKLDTMHGVPNSLFINHQRGWQYAGNVSITGIVGKVDIDLFDKEYVIYKKTPVVETEATVEKAPTETAAETVNYEAKFNSLVAGLKALTETL
ncbi:MAG TPA: glycoside hydrolase domain-containing protein [Candidatus Saccharimonadales bacterium]|jgi:hypothetical protein